VNQAERRLYGPGDVARLRWPVALEGRRSELPAGTLVRVVEELEPERRREPQVVRCAVGVKSIVGYVVVTRRELESIGPIEQFVEAIEQIERGNHEDQRTPRSRPARRASTE
jgi:hypothetical protein